MKNQFRCPNKSNALSAWILLLCLAAPAAVSQEGGSFQVQNGLLEATVNVTGQGIFDVTLKLIDDTSFRLVEAAPSKLGVTQNTFASLTRELRLYWIDVKQGDVEIARYDVVLLLKDVESLSFSLLELTALEMAPSKSLQEVCNDFGCFTLQTKVDGLSDGVIDTDEGVSEKKVFWDREELTSIESAMSMPQFTDIERVGHSAAASAVVVMGDWCMNQDFDTQGDDPVYHATNPASGFFVSDSVIVTTADALLTMEERALNGTLGDTGLSLPAEFHGPNACASYSAFLNQKDSRYNLESGAGPIVQLADGRWGLGEVIWTNDESGLGAIRLKAVAKNRREPMATWAQWRGIESNEHWLQIAATNIDNIGETATLHHPNLSRSEGGWFVSPSSSLNCSGNLGSTNLYLNHYSDGSSNGAPIIDDTGVVVAIVKSQTNDPEGILCPANQAVTTKNTLGPLPRYYADGDIITVGSLISAELLRELEIIEPELNSTPGPSELLNRPAVSLENFQRFEVPIMNDSFTVSGFPVAALNSTAIDIAKQATVAFIRETGCPTCDENRLNLNFNVPCICTGFAVTETLIITNDHCVTELALGANTTFRTYFGQDVEAELIGKTSIDGETIMNSRYYEIFGGIVEEGVLTGGHRGDVALLRTKQKMQLTPLKIADSSLLKPWDPLITVGHPTSMNRTGPWVTGVGSFLEKNYFTRTSQAYNLPAQRGASGSAVVNLSGELVGQIAYGGVASGEEKTTTLPNKYGLFAVELVIDRLETVPAPYSRETKIPISPQVSKGAPSNYIREMIEKWAPGELP